MMEHSSTPIIGKKWQSLDEKELLLISNIDKDKLINFTNNSNKPDSQFFDHISPVRDNVNKKIPDEVLTDIECDRISPVADNVNKKIPDEELSDIEYDQTIVPINSQQNDETSDQYNSTSSEVNDNNSESESSTEYNDSFSQEMDVKEVKETMMEMSQAVHKYLNKIKHLNISVAWELPNTLRDNKGIRKSVSGLKGPLDPEEVSFIKERLRQFCEEYNINYSAIRACLAEKVSKFNFPNEIRLKFLQYLCKDYVNDRNPLTVYRAISKLGLRKGKFSKEEEKFVVDMYHNYKGSCLHSVCGLLLNRHRSSIIKKIGRLKKKEYLGSRPSPNRVVKSKSKLRKLILENILHRRNYDVKSLKCRLNNHTWISIGREYNVSPAVAKAIYICEILPQVLAEHPVKFNSFFSKMLHRLKRSNWTTWEDVKWNRLSTVLYDVGPFFVYVMLRKLVMNCVPKEKWNDFKGCVKHLCENMLPYFEEQTKITLNKILIKKVVESS